MSKEKKEKNQLIAKNFGRSSSVVFSFDTTGSMRWCIEDVREKLQQLALEMFTDIPDLRIGLIAHGDYCDRENCITYLDFTSDQDKIFSFISKVKDTSGGDGPECYELVLHQAQKLSWPEEGGTLVMIGDADPHTKEVAESQIKQYGIRDAEPHDWKEELQILQSKNVKTFAFSCRGGAFWQELADLNDTPHLKLETKEDFKSSAYTLGAVVAASTGGVSGYSGYSGYSGLAGYSKFLSGDDKAGVTTTTCFMNNVSALTSWAEKEDLKNET